MAEPSTLSPDIIKQIRHIHLRTNRMADELLQGSYHSAFKGHGMEFDQVREYEAGDDIRLIDWNVTARMDAPYIKEYVEERGNNRHPRCRYQRQWRIWLFPEIKKRNCS